MSSQAFPTAQVLQFPGPACINTARPVDLPPVLRRAAAKGVEIKYVQSQSAPNSGFWLGVCFALGFEAVAATCILGLYCLCHWLG